MIIFNIALSKKWRIFKKPLALVLLLLTMSSCSAQLSTDEMDDDPVLNDKSMNFLALGDSYTIGESVSESERWPVQLSKTLSDEGINFQEPLIVARTGWTTDELTKGIAAAKIDKTFDLVSLLIGVNNQYRGRSSEQFRTEFVGLLHQAIAFAGGMKDRVFVVSIPDWGVTPFAQGRDKDKIAKEIDAFNLVCKEEAEKAGIKYFDITPISRMAVQDPGLIAPDGLHPSGKMYAAWVELMLPTIKAQFK